MSSRLSSTLCRSLARQSCLQAASTSANFAAPLGIYRQFWSGSNNHLAAPFAGAPRGSSAGVGEWRAGARGAAERRTMCMSQEDYNKRIDEINSQFAEARLLIEVGALVFRSGGQRPLGVALGIACTYLHYTSRPIMFVRRYSGNYGLCIGENDLHVFVLSVVGGWGRRPSYMMCYE